VSIKPFNSVPTNLREWSKFFNETEVRPSDGSVDDDTLRDSQPLSVIGRPENTAGTPRDITAASNQTFLGRKSNALDFYAIADADIPATIARDSEVTSAISAAITTHEAAVNPHSVYLTQTEGDARYVQLSNVLAGSATYDPPDLATGAVATTTVTVTGAAAGDFALASHADVATTDADKVEINAKVTATNTVTVYFRNNHSGNVNLASGTLRVRVWKQ
jgi:hypothetical protein